MNKTIFDLECEIGVVYKKSSKEVEIRRHKILEI
jgi:hypothetical protein